MSGLERIRRRARIGRNWRIYQYFPTLPVRVATPPTRPLLPRARRRIHRPPPPDRPSRKPKRKKLRFRLPTEHRSRTPVRGVRRSPTSQQVSLPPLVSEQDRLEELEPYSGTPAIWSEACQRIWDPGGSSGAETEAGVETDAESLCSATDQSADSECEEFTYTSDGVTISRIADAELDELYRDWDPDDCRLRKIGGEGELLIARPSEGALRRAEARPELASGGKDFGRHVPSLFFSATVGERRLKARLQDIDSALQDTPDQWGSRSSRRAAARALLDRPVRCLKDSGATRNFVSEKVAIQMGLPIETAESPLRVTLADGSSQQCARIARVHLRLTPEYAYDSLFYVLPMGMDVDFVLGMPWLLSIERFYTNVRDRRMVFSHRVGSVTRRITLQSMEMPPSRVG